MTDECREVVKGIIEVEYGQLLNEIHGFDLSKLDVIEFDNGSSNYNNHWYIVEIDGQTLTLYRDDSECTDVFELGTPAFEYGVAVS